MTPKELKQQLNDMDTADYCGETILEKGKISDNKSTLFDYKISHGWDVILSYKCDREWKAFNLVLYDRIRTGGYSKEEKLKILSQIQTQDSHWDWFKKSWTYRTDEYEWFYLLIDGHPQGACLFYHPKESLLDAENIFYIEFIAVAPWNRKTPLSEKEFKGVGTLLIKCALRYAIDDLNLRCGFSLNALPQAIEYYEKIGMTHFPERDYNNMPYFEMSRDKSEELLGGL